MKKLFVALFAGLLLIFSCTGNKTPRVEEEVAEDSAADTTEVSVTDSLEQLIMDTPMPRAADAMFDDFIFNFAANKRLQLERIVFPLNMTEKDTTVQVERSAWKMEHLFMNQGYYTLLFNNDKQMSLMKDTAVNEAIVEKIQLRKKQVKNYVFHRIRGAWMMTEVRVTPLEENVNASFLAFYQRFVTDSAFQVQSLNSMVEFVGPDPDDDFHQLEGVITPDTWEVFAPQLPSRTLYNIIYGKSVPEGNEKIFLMRGVANGLETELRFKKVGNKWLLMKLTT
ncbi:MAG: DUF4348 domain-containing protein [Prevotella sp.]|nr:DUF4348 domain-containing protein [Prevotella sp.]